jgi:hypothetical protein
MSASEVMHLAADISHIHTDYLWGAPEWAGAADRNRKVA